MEIARINIVADPNFLRKEALRREANTCGHCGGTVNFEVSRQDERVLEKTVCPRCGTEESTEHGLQ